MRTRSAAITAATLTLAGGLVATPASAATYCELVAATPPFVVVGNKPVNVTFDVTSRAVEVPDEEPEPTEPEPTADPQPTTEPEPIDPDPEQPGAFAKSEKRMEAQLDDAARGKVSAQSGCIGDAWGMIEADQGLFLAVAPAPVFQFQPSKMANSMMGRHDVLLYDATLDLFTGVDTVDLRRHTSWGATFDASEPVKRNTNVTLKGRLTRVNWGKGDYASYTGRPVEIQFQPVGGHFSTVARTTTGKGGWVNVGVRATRDGAWRFWYPGSVVASQAYSKPDYVDTVDKLPAKAPVKPGTKPAPKPRPKPVHYVNCDAVRRAGKAPLYRGEPGYRSGLDRDNDGVACE